MNHFSLCLFTLFDLSAQLSNLILNLSFFLFSSFDLQIFPFQFFLKLLENFPYFLYLTIFFNQTDQFLFLCFLELTLPRLSLLLHLSMKLFSLNFQLLNFIRASFHPIFHINFFPLHHFQLVFVFFTNLFYFVSPVHVLLFETTSKFIFFVFKLIFAGKKLTWKSK